MNASLSPASRRLLAGLLGSLLTVAAWAFPPAPDHLIYGYVRDEQGTPLNRPNAEVWLEANDRVLVKVPVITDSEPGVNYRLAIPVDSGLTGDLYTPNALRPTVPFRLRVKIGGRSQSALQPPSRRLLRRTQGQTNCGNSGIESCARQPQS